MALNSQTMPQKRYLIPILLVVLAAVPADARKFRFDDVCLSVDMRQHEYYSSANRIVFGSPFLLIPAPYPTPELTDDEDRTGLGVYFSPITERQRERRITRRDRSDPGDCIETPYGFGLVEVSDDPLHQPKSTDPITCAAVSTHTDLVPEDINVPVEIDCPGPGRAGACWGSYFLEQDFEARVLISREDVPEWRVIGDIVQTFFNNEVEVCTR